MSAQVEIAAPPRLRILALGDLLDETVRLYRRDFVRFVGVAALATVPILVVQMASAFLQTRTLTPFLRSSGSSSPDPSVYGPIMLQSAVQIGGAVIAGIMTMLMVGALAYVAGTSYLGQPATMGQGYRLALRRFPVMLGAGALIGLILLLLGVFTLIPCIGWLGGPAAIAFVLVNSSLLLLPVIMLEGHGVRTSLRRTWALSKSQFWRVLAIAVIMYLFNLAVIGGPASVVSVLVAVTLENTILASVISLVMSALVSLIFTPLWSVCQTLLYYDARVRREAFDLELIAGTGAAPYDETEPLVAGSDAKTLGILLLIAVPACGLLSVIAGPLYMGLLGPLRGLR